MAMASPLASLSSCTAVSSGFDFHHCSGSCRADRDGILTLFLSKQDGGQVVTVIFDTGDDEVEVSAKVGENLLRVAEKYGVLVPNTDFCYEGTCCHCEMEVEGGAPEVGYRANTSSEDLVRSCICPVPSREGPLRARILSEDSAWDDVL